MIINALLNFLSFLIASLGHRGQYILSYLLGVLSFDILRIRRRIILENLNIVFAEQKSQAEKIRIGRNSCIYFVKTTFEFFSAKRIFKKTKVSFINEAFINEIMARNEGIYAMCIHMGNWELLCHICSTRYCPVHVVVKAIGKGAVARWVENTRKDIGYHLINRNGLETATTQIFKVIDKKEIVGFIVDQKRPRGEMIPFFGRNASTNNSLAKLYLRKKAPIVPAIIRRKSIYEHEIICFPEFKFIEDNEKTFAENVTAFTYKMNEQVENMVRMNPEEYFWMHNRWNL